MKNIFTSFLLIALTCASLAQEKFDIEGYWELDSVQTYEANKNLLKEPIEWLRGKLFLISNSEILVLEGNKTTKYYYTFEKSEAQHIVYLKKDEKEEPNSPKIPLMIEEIEIVGDHMSIRIKNICGANQFHFNRLHKTTLHVVR